MPPVAAIALVPCIACVVLYVGVKELPTPSNESPLPVSVVVMLEPLAPPSKL